jgi:hypothetical protein
MLDQRAFEIYAIATAILLVKHTGTILERGEINIIS